MRWKAWSPVFAATLAFASLGFDCRGPDTPVVAGDTMAACGDTGRICTTGTVDFSPIEGGCWSIVSASGVRYDPAGSLPAGFKQDGLRVSFVAQPRSDMAHFCPGQIVQLVSISKLPASSSPQ